MSVAVAKIDVEGFECHVMSSGETLFSHVRPRFVLWEGLDRTADGCMRALARRYGYRIGHPVGIDRNTVMMRMNSTR